MNACLKVLLRNHDRGLFRQALFGDLLNGGNYIDGIILPFATLVKSTFEWPHKIPRAARTVARLCLFFHHGCA